MRRGRSRGVESGGAWTRGREPDERKPEALAAEKIDLEREPRQAISSGGLRFLLRWFGRRTRRESKKGFVEGFSLFWRVVRSSCTLFPSTKLLTWTHLIGFLFSSLLFSSLLHFPPFSCPVKLLLLFLIFTFSFKNFDAFSLKSKKTQISRNCSYLISNQKFILRLNKRITYCYFFFTSS